jgi:hypothetical protein
MGEDGVIGYMATTSLSRNATWAAASFPSIVTAFLVMSSTPFLFPFLYQFFKPRLPGTDADVMIL